MRFYATIHYDNSHSENPQRRFERVVVETGSNVTLTCQRHLAGKMTWIVGYARELKMPDCKNVETCNLTLPRPVTNQTYKCQVRLSDKCFYQKLEIKVESSKSE